MANEMIVRSGISVPGLSYNRQCNHTISLSSQLGPYIGSIDVPTDGVALDLSALASPGMALVGNQNTDDSYVQFGIRDPDSGLFYPLLQFDPRDSVTDPIKAYPLPLAVDLGEEYQGTGTGTGTPSNVAWLKAFGGPVTLLFEVLER